MLGAFHRHLRDAGVGSISEIFDATPPFLPRGCIAQAWSVAEVLRASLMVMHEQPASVNGRHAMAHPAE
jgi:glycogen debranching enzyme